MTQATKQLPGCRRAKKIAFIRHRGLFFGSFLSMIFFQIILGTTFFKVIMEFFCLFSDYEKSKMVPKTVYKQRLSVHVKMHVHFSMCGISAKLSTVSLEFSKGSLKLSTFLVS